MYEVCSVLKMLRKENHLSQIEIADKLEVSRASYCLWENGHRTPSKEKCEKICDLFNVDMNFLLGYSPIRNSYKDGIEIAIYNEKEKLQDSFYLPKGFLEENKTYWAEMNPKTYSVAIYCRETKGLVATFCKF